MAKGKNFSKSLGSKRLTTLIPTENESSQIEGKKIAPSKKEKTQIQSTTVTTFRVENENLLAVKAIAFWDRKKIQDVFNEALAQYLDSMPTSTLEKALAEYKKRKGL